MGLIKAQIAPQVVQFQWRDIEADAARHLSDAKREAEAIVQRARVAAEAVREEARLDGYQRGHEEGIARGRAEARQAAIAEYSQQLELTIAALNEAVSEIAAAHRAIADTSISEMVELSAAIAQRVTKRQAMIDPQVLIANLRDSLALIGRQKQIRVAIHPAQRQVLQAALPQMQVEWPALGAAQIVEDSSLMPGGCRVFTDHGQVDADVQAQLDRVIAGLMPERKKEEAA